MKLFRLLFTVLLVLSVINVRANDPGIPGIGTDTIITFLNEKLDPVPDSQAVIVSIAIHRDSLWEVGYYNLETKKMMLTAFAKEPDCKLLHGRYEEYHVDGKLSRRGWYNNGNKIGIWRNWNSNGDILDSMVYRDGIMLRNYKVRQSGPQIMFMEDDYENNRSITIIRWEDGTIYHKSIVTDQIKENWYYSPDGKLFKYVKSGKNHKILEEICYDEQGGILSDCRKAIAKNWYKTTPEFPGGNANFQLYIQNNLRIPKDFNADISVRYRSKVSFRLTPQGRATEIRIMESSHPDLDRALIELIQNMPLWNMKELRTGYGPIIIPIYFNL